MKLPIEGRWIVLIALVAAGFLGALVFAVRFVQLPVTKQLVAPVTSTGIGIARVDPYANRASLSDDALLDPDPLFLPTPFNASQPQLPPLIRREPGTASQPIAAKYAFAYEQAALSFPEVVSLPAQPIDSLTYGRVQNPYDVVGRFEREEAPLPSRLAVVEVVQVKTGKVVLSAEIAPVNVPLMVVNADWKPLELLAAVDATGLIGLPDLSRGSDVEAVDSFFRSYLAKQFHLGERLPPGLYALRVGP
jgi:hypothetical protein